MVIIAALYPTPVVAACTARIATIPMATCRTAVVAYRKTSTAVPILVSAVSAGRKSNALGRGCHSGPGSPGLKAGHVVGMVVRQRWQREAGHLAEGGKKGSASSKGHARLSRLRANATARSRPCASPGQQLRTGAPPPARVSTVPKSDALARSVRALSSTYLVSHRAPDAAPNLCLWRLCEVSAGYYLDIVTEVEVS